MFKYLLTICALGIGIITHAQEATPEVLPPDCLLPAPDIMPSDEWRTYLDSAQEHDAQRYAYALEQGVQFLPTLNRHTYSLLWLPETTTDTPPPMIVTLHGHASYALDEFFLWHDYAAERGYGILALQWWVGLDPDHDLQEEYLLPHEIYPIITRVLCDLGTPPQKVLLHGFSRGSANIYAVKALDQGSGNHFFGVVIANAGSSEKDFPPTRDIEQGKFGEQPFVDTHWILVCGGKDPAPERSGCPAMQRTETWLQGLGATIDVFIQDADGDHGVFHRNPEHVNAALELFAEFLTTLSE